MAKKNILELIVNTINQVQQTNEANPKEPTADPNIFDLLKNKLSTLETNQRNKRAQQGKTPVSILDMIKNEIEGVRTANKNNPNQETAPASIFDNIIKKVDQRPQRQASAGLRKVVEDYNLDVSRVPRDVIAQVQAKYINDRKAFDRQYAQALNDLAQKY